jgi:hypothetical protein
MTDESYFSTDEAEDVAGSIRHAVRCADLVSEDFQAWKWGFLALHSALQGACVCHMTTTAAPLGAVTKNNAKEWMDYHDASRKNQSGEPPDTKMMSLPDLLKSVRQQGSCGGFSDSKKIEISDKELAWLKRLHVEVRNQFVHFAPLGWSIEVSGMPQIGKTIARIIKDILDCGWAFRHLDQAVKDAMLVDLERLNNANWAT